MNIHLQTANELSAQQYREKWQIMKQLPLAGFAKRRKHSASIKAKIASGDVDPMALTAAMQEANRRNGNKKPFNTQYIAQEHGDRLKTLKLWEQSPAIKTVDVSIQIQAAQRMHQRDLTGESVQVIAEESGVVKQTLYVWRSRWPIQ